MKKQIIFSGLAAVTALCLTGCFSSAQVSEITNAVAPTQTAKAKPAPKPEKKVTPPMCSQPLEGDPSCKEKSHKESTSVVPSDCMAMVKPTIKAGKQIFRPVFTVGATRVTATGKGMTLEEATQDALANFLMTSKCDYIVGVTRIVSKKTHPTERAAQTTNYLVTISGLPVFLQKLEEEVTEKPVEIPEEKPLTKDEIVLIINETTNQVIVDSVTKAVDDAMEKNEASNGRNGRNGKNGNSSFGPFGSMKLSDVKIQITANGETSENVGVAFPAPAKCRNAAPAANAPASEAAAQAVQDDVSAAIPAIPKLPKLPGLN